MEHQNRTHKVAVTSWENGVLITSVEKCDSYHEAYNYAKNHTHSIVKIYNIVGELIYTNNTLPESYA